MALLAALPAFFASDFLLWHFDPWLRFCARYASPQSASDPLRTAARIGLLSRTEALPPVLLVGSSQIREGLDCAPIEARFPGRICWNLALAGGTPLDVLFVMDQVNRRVSRRVVVTNVSPQTFHGPPKRAFSDTRTLRCLATSGALAQLRPREWLDVLYGQAQNLSETLRNKDALRDMWRVIGPDPLAAWRREIPAQPSRALDDLPRPPASLIEARKGIVDPEIAPGRFTRAEDTALDEVLDGEVRRGNRVVVLDFPTRDGYETTITPAAVIYHRGLVERLAKRRGVLLLRRADLPALQDDDFRDFVHVTASGREKLSSAVTEVIARGEVDPP